MMYEKKFLNIDEQIKLLEDRGLIINDKKRAFFYLKHINYYYFSAYFKSFQDKDDCFKTGATFNDVLRVYNFDKKLRLILLDVLERVEMSFKSVLSHDITRYKNDLHWYLLEKDSYKQEDKRAVGKIEEVIKKLKNSKESYTQHYFKKYNEEKNVPAWIFFEELSFGRCVFIAKNLKDAERQVIAAFYKLSKKGCIQMLHNLSLLRNLCAHHSLVWNKKFTFKSLVYKKYKDLFHGVNNKSLFPLIIFIQIFVKKISPRSTWLDRLENLVNEYEVEVSSMGFPEKWREKLNSINN